MSKYKTILKLIKKSNAIQILSDTIPMEINLLNSNLLKIYFCYLYLLISKVIPKVIMRTSFCKYFSEGQKIFC